MTASIETGLPRPGTSMRDEEGNFDNQTVVPFEPSAKDASGERKSPVCLVVEDDSILRHLVTNYLEDHDIRAVSASRRDEVSGLLARSEPDLVVLDLRLGQEDGLDLLRDIRAQSDVLAAGADCILAACPSRRTLHYFRRRPRVKTQSAGPPAMVKSG